MSFKKLEKTLLEKIGAATQKAYGQLPEQIELGFPPNTDLGHFAVGCFDFAKQFRKSPAEIAEHIVDNIDPDEVIEQASAAGPYINLKIKPDRFFGDLCRHIISLDAGYGSCILRDPVCAGFVAETMNHFDGTRYQMASFVVMPNHVHSLFQLLGRTKLERVLGTWKVYSAREINKHIGQRGALWRQESRDTSIRNPVHLNRCFWYIRDNPTKAHLKPGEFFYYAAPEFEARVRAWNGDIKP